ncbi:MAG: 3'(2'),5'-bisphosphate nucleotidase CysQ [Actinomycetota bacterium]|nr:3'(2'),5'-bisphosphate nucleotidase CysQ [Actinomycetota bacterium]MDQ3640149.1 3'(2'),5'-bisphosphate nucleotidase CysQ [Actinomycetota bacterium]
MPGTHDTGAHGPGPDDPGDHVLASRLAVEAGEVLVSLRHRLGREGVDRSALGTEGDRRAHALIVDSLAASRPRDPVLSEEGVHDTVRLGERRVWVVDPLDGTREFSEGRSDWAVHVALVVDHEPVVGAVALPGDGLVLDTSRPPVVPPAGERPLRLVVSRSRPPELARSVAERLGAELVAMGSAGAKAMAVLRGEADIYLHAGGQYEWDSAAPVAVALTAGLHASRLDGSPLRYNQPDAYLPDLLVCRTELAAKFLELCEELGAGSDR